MAPLVAYTAEYVFFRLNYLCDVPLLDKYSIHDHEWSLHYSHINELLGTFISDSYHVKRLRRFIFELQFINFKM